MRKIKFLTFNKNTPESRDLLGTKGDLTLCCGEYFSISCHKDIVSPFSVKIRNLPGKVNVLNLDLDVSKKALGLLLTLIYSGSIEVYSSEVVSILHAGYVLGVNFSYENEIQAFELLCDEEDLLPSTSPASATPNLMMSSMSWEWYGKENER